MLRSVAGIEKKRSILQGMEKDVVARHEVRFQVLWLFTILSLLSLLTGMSRFLVSSLLHVQLPVSSSDRTTRCASHAAAYCQHIHCAAAVQLLQVGHALVSTAVSKILPGSAPVQKLSIIPRTGGALGFTYIPPNTGEAGSQHRIRLVFCCRMGPVYLLESVCLPKCSGFSYPTYPLTQAK